MAAFDIYPMPKANILIDQLGKVHYLPALHMTNSYWQVAIDPQDWEKMAFASPLGPFQFRRMPFGLYGEADTFQRLVDVALAAWEELITLLYALQPGKNTRSSKGGPVVSQPEEQPARI